MTEHELRGGDGRIIRPTNTRALAEIRMMLETAIAYDKPILWTSLGMLCQQHAAVLLTALPTEHDPSTREERAYEDGCTRTLDALDAWIVAPKEPDPDLATQVLDWIRGRR